MRIYVQVFPSVSLRAKIKFPPANEKAVWETPDSQVNKELVVAVNYASSLADRIDMFTEVAYCQSLWECEDSGRKGIAYPQKSKRQRRIEELRKRMNCARKQF